SQVRWHGGGEESPDRVLCRDRSGGPRPREELPRTRRAPDGNPQPVHRCYGEAPGTSEGDDSETSSSRDVLQSGQPCCSAVPDDRARCSPPTQGGASGAASRVGRGAAGGSARAPAKGSGCVLLRVG